jgi:hypothetical protein
MAMVNVDGLIREITSMISSVCILRLSNASDFDKCA